MTERANQPGPALPSGRWPSTWPALWRPVRDRAIFVGVTVVLTLAGTAQFGDLGLSWWVPLLPLVLVLGPVTRPARVRRRFERAAARNALSVQSHRRGWQLHPPGRRGNVVALVSGDGELTYVDCSD
ncbi:MAG: hypothetical protein H0V64_04320 [Geodermatophilaceae bacterium]|nr:hypothetical protein [Geodermatophilaceae bacterium]MDQ3466056.1 hypothetical protein [Actinomycetota bacterium]